MQILNPSICGWKAPHLLYKPTKTNGGSEKIVQQHWSVASVTFCNIGPSAYEVWHR
jgi:hypothetical protein